MKFRILGKGAHKTVSKRCCSWYPWVVGHSLSVSFLGHSTVGCNLILGYWGRSLHWTKWNLFRSRLCSILNMIGLLIAFSNTSEQSSTLMDFRYFPPTPFCPFLTFLASLEASVLPQHLRVAIKLWSWNASLTCFEFSALAKKLHDTGQDIGGGSLHHLGPSKEKNQCLWISWSS